MSDLCITIESLTDELMDAYLASGMERGKAGRAALNWAFSDNQVPFAVARHDGKIVGMSSYIQSRMQFGEEQGVAFQAVDSFVSEAMRGKGVFIRLARAYEDYAKRSEADLVWGFPNDNAAPAWFGKLGWKRHGQVPFLIKPLRAGFFARKFKLPIDFPLTRARDHNLEPIGEVGDWGNTLWENVASQIGVGVVRDRIFLNHRLFSSPQAWEYRVVAEADGASPALVATREAKKHGGHIAYVMEALGQKNLEPLLMSELGRLASNGAEIALVWAYPWSPNYGTLRKAGFLPLPERFRPIHIWFGGRSKTNRAECANELSQWYLSYLDSDTI